MKNKLLAIVKKSGGSEEYRDLKYYQKHESERCFMENLIQSLKYLGCIAQWPTCIDGDGDTDDVGLENVDVSIEVDASGCEYLKLTNCGDDCQPPHSMDVYLEAEGSGLFVSNCWEQEGYIDPDSGFDSWIHNRFKNQEKEEDVESELDIYLKEHPEATIREYMDYQRAKRNQ